MISIGNGVVVLNRFTLVLLLVGALGLGILFGHYLGGNYPTKAQKNRILHEMLWEAGATP